MILNLPITKGRATVRKLNWKYQFRRNVYMQGQQILKTQQKQRNVFDDLNQKKKVEKALLKWLQQGLEDVRVRDKTSISTPHSCYSFYLPLTVQTRFTDELAIAIPTLKRLEEAGRVNDRNLLLLEVSEYLKECIGKGEADRGWLRCLRRYVCDLDSLRALEMFLEVKKRGGVKPSSQIHKQFGGECLPQIFFQRIQWCSQFYKPPKKISLLQFSMDPRQKVSEVSMPKTMKWLFCNICLLYDCNQHFLSDEIAKQKGYNYVAPKSIVPQSEQALAAITIFAQYQHLQKMGSIPKGVPCSPKCYKLLQKSTWDELQKRRAALLSPLVKGIIKMGIHLFSYYPCQAWFLLADRGLTCDLAFLFMVEDQNLAARLQRRLHSSQAQALQWVGRQEEPIKARMRGRAKRRMQVAHSEPTCEISACLHYYLGEGVIDKGCESCDCKVRGFCLPQCLCDQSCPIRKRGCQCRKEDCRGQKCPCFKHNEECDPYICKSCFSKRECLNHQVLEGRRAKVRVGRSTVSGAGLGLFALEVIKAGQMVQTYTGELIQFSIDILRESLSVDNSFYNFSSKEGTIDARFMGNLSRFINHADQQNQNLYSQALLSQGRFKIAFFAKRDINPHEQLFFDYDGEGQLYQHFQHKYPFIKKKKNKK